MILYVRFFGDVDVDRVDRSQQLGGERAGPNVGFEVPRDPRKRQVVGDHQRKEVPGEPRCGIPPGLPSRRTSHRHPDDQADNRRKNKPEEPNGESHPVLQLHAEGHRERGAIDRYPLHKA
jgi:hypothetical protein